MLRNQSISFVGISVALLLIGVFFITAGDHSASSESAATFVQVELPKNRPSAEQTLQIVRFNYHKTSNSLLDIEVGIKNVTQTTQDGFAWYILAPAGSAEPWREAHYSAPEQALSLAPGMSETLQFDPPAAIPDGEYDLSVWVHRVHGQERVHSDGAGAERPIYIGQPFAVNVIDIDQIEQIDGSLALEVTVEASNHSGKNITADLLFTVIAARQTGSLSGLPEFISNRYAIDIDDGERAASTLRGAVRLEPGVYSVVGWLRRRDTNAVLSRVVSTTVINIE